MATFNNKIINKISVNFKFYNTPTKSEIEIYSMCVCLLCLSIIVAYVPMSSILLIFDFFVFQILFFSKGFIRRSACSFDAKCCRRNSFSLNLSRIK